MVNPRALFVLSFCLICTVFLSPSMTSAQAGASAAIDLSKAVVVPVGKLTGPEKKAIQMLVEEVEKRSGIRLQTNVSSPSAPQIRIHSSTSRRSRLAGPESYSLVVERGQNQPVIDIHGYDSRGVLYGVGHLLRSLQISRGRITLTSDLRVTSAPKVKLRGHQLGYRPKPNSYDGWTVSMWEQYIRDLVIFGSNAVELIPPRSDDEPDSPHFPLPQMEMMIEMSRILDEYDMDVWIWYPALDEDYSNPATVEFALKEWGEVFRKLPRVDAVLVPGGDPGHTRPLHLMALLEKQTSMLRKYHPKATMWVAPQSFGREWMEEFFNIVKREPAWLTGIAFGPQTSVSLPQLRERIPSKYPIRHYPDITHSLICQYPVADWDQAYALTEGREGINPRPHAQAHIFRETLRYTNGYITYSEGCNDDVNKFIWSGLGWNPDADVMEILRDYSRYFISPVFEDSFAQGLVALEKNWDGPLLANSSVYSTLQQFRAMERSATPANLLNWRFQQALYRAYYDAYTRSRLIYETHLEEEALNYLRRAREISSENAMKSAELVLRKASTEGVSSDWRSRIFELAEALYQSIRMQLSVERYKALAVGRGANLDTVNYPLNNRPWLETQFAEIRKIDNEGNRLSRLNEIVNWTNPGPGGFYDDLGNPARQPHLVKGPGFLKDPAFYESPRVGFTRKNEGPNTWWNHAETFYGAPMSMRYMNLDPSAQYIIKVVYAGEENPLKIRLVADEKYEVHSFIKKEFKPVEFNVPREATSDGELNLTWTRDDYQRGNGRGLQISEVWLKRK